MLEKTYDAASIEPRMAKVWEEADAFAAGAGAREGADPFTIVIPPPNVTGSLHMGHALNNTLQDILVRFERMRGKNVLWQPGMDHAGIATQMVVERQLAEDGSNVTRRDMGREAFVERVWQWKEQSGGTIFNQLRRLGASCDWSRERFTMDEGLSKAVLDVFVQLYEEGLIYRDKRLVNWDPVFETAISDLEVENIEVDGHMWHFKYPLEGGATYEYVERDEDGNVTVRETRDYISIATTRPETMLGDGAVAVHPDDQRYAPIVGKLCEIPVGPKEHRRLIPIITDEYPDPDFGSGAVKITGAHDANDYDVARRNAIPLFRLMDARATMRADGASYSEAAAAAMTILKAGEEPSPAQVDAINLVPDAYRGLDRYEARKRVIADIDAEGLMIRVEDKKVMQPFGDRSGVVIEPMLTDQWYVDAKTLAEPAIASVREGRTEFVPKSWEKTYYEWMENIQPWCISRQLWWGHRIPVWYGPRMGDGGQADFDDPHIFVAKSSEEALRKAHEVYGFAVTECEDRLAAQGLTGQERDSSAAAIAIWRDEDVLDTWFSSALWPFSTLGWPEQTRELDTYYQTDVLVTAFDIIFFWVARMMMMGLHFMKEEPFHTVYIHALVRDAKGAKMSKSKGNVIDPLELIDQYGADALRFTLAIMAAQGRDVKLDPERVAGYRNFGTKLWNATRFAQLNEMSHAPDFKPVSARHPLNRWVLTQLSQTIADVTANIEAYRFNDASSALYRFVWNSFCDWYLELSKPVYAEGSAAEQSEMRHTTAFVLDTIYTLLHPFMPHMTEALWRDVATQPRDTLLCHAAWPDWSFADADASTDVEWLIDLVSQIRSVRSEMNIKPGATVPITIVDANAKTKDRLQSQMSALQRLARVEAASIDETVPQGSVQLTIGEATACLVLKDVIDFSAETARLEKEAAAIDKDIKQLTGKLGNEKFLANAAAHIVEEARQKLADAEQKKAKNEEAQQRMRAFAG
ncbi:MAG: valine--tRNA ligase [Ahrensia sp.]|nr:valine--tRNA ligase [Ahrensia sp.]